jgi:hypothetical protein
MTRPQRRWTLAVFLPSTLLAGAFPVSQLDLFASPTGKATFSRPACVLTGLTPSLLSQRTRLPGTVTGTVRMYR